MQPYILMYWKQIENWIRNYFTAVYILTYILIEELYHGMRSTRAWFYHMYNNKHTRQKSLKMYMKSWRSRLARLYDMFDTYIKENYKVVEYQINSPSMREHDLTWKPYGYYKRRKAKAAHKRCIALKSMQIIEARSARNKERRLRMEYDTDSFDILIDNCCSHTLPDDINDYIEPPVKSSVRVRGYNGNTNSTMAGTVKWKIEYNKGKIHSFILPNTNYSPSVETRLLSPQHWAQTRKKGRDSYCITYHDAIIMRWNKVKYQITAPLDNRKHRNMGVVRSSSGITQYLTSCQAIDEEFTTLAYPATICMDCKIAEVTDDEASVEAPKVSQEKSEKEMDGVRPVMPTEVEQMREEIFKDKETESILHDDDKTEEEDFPTFSQDSQEYMHWHYRLNHPTHIVTTKMAKQGMGKQHTKPPMCNDCCGAKATRTPWTSKGKGYIQKHLKKTPHPGEVVSVDQLESSIPGFIGQMTGKLTNQCIEASTVYVVYASDLSYVYHQTSMTSEETLKSKLAFEKFAASHGVNIKHYGVGAHHQNGIAEKRIEDLQRRATTLLLHAQRRWPDAINSHLWTYAIRAANDSRNYAPTNKNNTCPMSRFCNTVSVPKIQNQHHFGCPTYVLKKELQDHKKIKKWSDRTRIGINLGYLSRHAHSVSLTLNLQTGLVSPQYHS
jgi:hypothetical protein